MPREKDTNELGALWFKESQNGEYMTGSVTIDGKETRLVCFRVKSQSPKAPHWRILRSVPRDDRPKREDSDFDEGSPF